MTYTKIAKALVAAGFVLGGVTLSHAQDGNQSFDEGPSYVGRTNAMGPNCPPMEIHVVPKGKNVLQGVAWGVGEGGMSVYTVTGTLADNSAVVMDLKPIGGGPGMKVEGTFKNGMLMAKMGAGTCHAGGAMLMMPYVRPTTRAGGGGG